jgi:hypothetical protein
LAKEKFKRRFRGERPILSGLNPLVPDLGSVAGPGSSPAIKLRKRVLSITADEGIGPVG